MDLLDMESELEIKALRAEIEKLKSNIEQYKKVIVDNELTDEIEGLTTISAEEKICLDGINYLAKVFENGDFDKNDTANFDILHKNLRMIRGQDFDKKKKKGKFDKKEALAIVSGIKDGES